MSKYYFLRKIAVAFLSSFLLCLVMALINYIPVSEQKEGTYNWSFSALMTIFLIYSVPVILVGGTLFSISIDKLIVNLKFLFSNMITKLLILTFAYLIGGIVVTTLFLMITSHDKVFNFGDSLNFYIYGIIGALMYLYLDEFIKSMVVQKSRRP